MGKSGDFRTFDETRKDLEISVEQLMRLVSDGCIRAFRDGDQMKFRKYDVEDLSSKIATGEKYVIRALNRGIKNEIAERSGDASPGTST